MSTDEVLFFITWQCAVGCRHVMRVRRAAAQIVIVQEFVGTSARIFTVAAFFSFEIKSVQSHMHFFGSVSMVA